MNVIITGTTGMVGKSVLLECLDHPQIEKILVINRRSINMKDPKLVEIIHSNFHDLSLIKEQLKSYDACFFCMGVSSVGMNEETYNKLTFDITKHFADVLFEINPEMVFNYVSGTGTDSSEKGNVMWARVKGRTENYILNKGFKAAFMFRPGIIIPEKGIRSSTNWYQYFYNIMTPFFPILKKMSSITTTTKLGKAMINTVLKGYNKKHLENIDINKISNM